MRSIEVGELDAVQGGLDLRSVQVRQQGSGSAVDTGSSFGDVPLLGASDPSLAGLPDPAPATPAGGQDPSQSLGSLIQQILGGHAPTGNGADENPAGQSPAPPTENDASMAGPTAHAPVGHNEPTDPGDPQGQSEPMGHGDPMGQGDPMGGEYGGMHQGDMRDEMAMAGPGGASYGDDMGGPGGYQGGYQDYGGESGYC